MKKSELGILSFILFTFVVSHANASMILTISPLGSDLSFELVGAVDTSVFDRQFTINPNPMPRYLHNPNTSSTSSTSMATTATVALWSNVDGSGFRFSDDAAFTPFGVFPTFGTQLLDATPGFQFGFRDETVVVGQPTDFPDLITLPDGYVSGEQVNLSFIEPNMDLGAIGLVPGDFFGVSFVDGMSQAQFVAVRAVPEPCSIAWLVALSFIARRQRAM